MNETIKSKIGAKNILYKKCIQNRRFESDFVCLQNFLIDLTELISSTKALYYENLAKKLNNPLLQAKTYWSIIKTFYNDKTYWSIIKTFYNDKTYWSIIKTFYNDKSYWSIIKTFYNDKKNPTNSTAFGR